MEVTTDREIKQRVFRNLLEARNRFPLQTVADKCGVPLDTILGVINARPFQMDVWNNLDIQLTKILFEKE